MESNEHSRRDMSPVIAAAVLSLKKVAGVDTVIIVKDLMYEKDGKYGADIVIDDELTGLYNTFLSEETAKNIVAFPNGIFVAQEFVYHVLNPKHINELFDDKSDEHIRSDESLVIPLPEQHFSHIDPDNPQPEDYEFDILKTIDEDGTMHFPPPSDKPAIIETLPGAADLKKKKK